MSGTNSTSNFKSGISDAILRGEMIDATKPSEYKAGYDFGMTIYSDLIESGLIDSPISEADE
jgi:hypothetical protein